MKNLLSILLCLMASFSFSQSSCKAGESFQGVGGRGITNFVQPSLSTTAESTLSKAKLDAVKFETASISFDNENKKIYLARFNPYLNEFEIKLDDNKIVYLNRIENSKICFVQSKKSYFALSYIDKDGNSQIGYFTNIDDSNLFKKSDYTYVKAKKSDTGYGSSSDTPAKYNEKVTYYYKNINDKIVKLEKRKNDLVKSFSGLSKEIKSFIKTKKISLRKKENLILLTNYIHSLESQKYINKDLAVLNNKK